jgi:hypothetical protein
MVHISERPPEADERRVPGHWEGDLLIGQHNQTAIGTLVERSSGFAMLVPLPDGYKPEHVAPALARKVQTLPAALRRSRTWDQGPEMRDWKQIHVDAGIDVFFCDPHAPWQRGSNENTNGLLRQYSPRASTSPPSPSASSTPSPTNSTTAPASASTSPPQPSSSRNCCCTDRQNPPFGLRNPCAGVRRFYLVCEGSGLGGGGPDARARRER